MLIYVYQKGSENEKKHALYVWDNFIMRRVKAKHIVIMAHSYGGDVTVSLVTTAILFIFHFYDSSIYISMF